MENITFLMIFSALQEKDCFATFNFLQATFGKIQNADNKMCCRRRWSSR